MGFTEILTIVFVILKLIGIIDWNWFFVLLPEIIACVGYFALFIAHIALVAKVHKEQKKMFDSFDNWW